VTLCVPNTTTVSFTQTPSSQCSNLPHEVKQFKARELMFGSFSPIHQNKENEDNGNTKPDHSTPSRTVMTTRLVKALT
jgi:hypothetical protein